MPTKLAIKEQEVKWCGKFCFDSKTHHHECPQLVTIHFAAVGECYYCYRYCKPLETADSGYAKRCLTCRYEFGEEEE